MSTIESQWLGRVTYKTGLELQENAVKQRLAGETADTVYLLEHEPVYTIGRTRDRSSLGEDDSGQSLPHPIFETNRGGQATFHGPGQLVGYPILDLKQFGRDLHVYLRCLEEALIDACKHYGILAQRREGLTGVFVAERKLASIGVGVRHWISMHGFAINVGSDLSGFNAITPCGIQDVQMTSVSIEADTEVSVEVFSDHAFAALVNALDKLRA